MHCFVITLTPNSKKGPRFHRIEGPFMLSLHLHRSGEAADGVLQFRQFFILRCQPGLVGGNLLILRLDPVLEEYDFPGHDGLGTGRIPGAPPQFQAHPGVPHVFPVAEAAAQREHSSLIGPVEGPQRHGMGIPVTPHGSGEIPFIIGVEVQGMQPRQRCRPGAHLIHPMPQAVDITLEGDDGVPVQCHLVVQGLDILCRAVILPDVDTVIRYPGFLIYSPAIHRIGGVTGNVGICHIGNGSAPISGEGNLRLIYRFPSLSISYFTVRLLKASNARFVP